MVSLYFIFLFSCVQLESYHWIIYIDKINLIKSNLEQNIYYFCLLFFPTSKYFFTRVSYYWCLTSKFSLCYYVGQIRSHRAWPTFPIRYQSITIWKRRQMMDDQPAMRPRIAIFTECYMRFKSHIHQFTGLSTLEATQWAHNAIITSSLRPNDVTDVVLT